MTRMRALFAGPKLEGRLDLRKADIAVEIWRLDSGSVTGKPDRAVADIVRRYHIEPVRVLASKKTMKFHKDRAGGLLMTASVPYTGSIDIVDCRPPGAGASPRVWGAVRKADEMSGILAVKFHIPASVDEDDACMRFNFWHHVFMKHLNAANQAVCEFNDSLPDMARFMIAKRTGRPTFSFHTEDVDDLKQIMQRAA